MKKSISFLSTTNQQVLQTLPPLNQAAYTDAHHKKSFQVKAEALAILENQVSTLHDMTKEICESYISRLA